MTDETMVKVFDEDIIHNDWSTEKVEWFRHRYTTGMRTHHAEVIKKHYKAKDSEWKFEREETFEYGFSDKDLFNYITNWRHGELNYGFFRDYRATCYI